MVEAKLMLVEEERVEVDAINEIEFRLVGKEAKISEEVEKNLHMNIDEREGNGLKHIKVLEEKCAPCCEDPNLIRNNEYGMVCTNCGTVREQIVMEKFDKPSAGYYSNQYGGFDEIINSNRNYRTTFKKSKVDPQLLRALKLDRRSYEERTKSEAESFIFNTAKHLSLTKNQAKDCFLFFAKIWEQKNNKGIEMQAMMIAAMYTNLKIEGFFIPIQKFIDLYDMDKSKVENAVTRIATIIQACPKLKDKWKTKLEEDYPSKLLNTINALMNLHENIYKNAKKIIKSKRCMQKIRLENKNNPYALIAGAVYLACQIVKGRIPKEKLLTQDLIAEKLDITVVTLREYYQYLYEIFEQQINRTIQKYRTATAMHSTEEEEIMD